MGVVRPPWISKEWFTNPQIIQDTFFPQLALVFEELGCEEYDVCFGGNIKKKTISSPH